MMLSVPRPRNASRSHVLPGLSLRFGDMLDGLFRIDTLVDTERSILQLAGSQVADGTPVVIQILVADGPSADQARLRFMAGVRKANTLKGPHVARVLDIGITPEGHPYVVREKVAPRSLASFLEQKHSLPNEQAVALALDVCDALAEAHRHGLIHGDLGPRSIHLGWAHGPANVKVIDLGIGAAMAELGLAASTIEHPSLHLRAPEQLVPGRIVDVRADVWAVGSLVYTMLAGAPPFMADTPSSISVAVENDEPASLAGVPDALADLVDACLAKDPAQRPATIGALAEALAAFSPEAGESLSRIRTHAAALATTIETPSLAMPPHAAPMPAESSPTIVARQGYESFAHRATRADADATAPRNAAAAVAKAADSSVEIPIVVDPSVRDLAKVGKPLDMTPVMSKVEPKKVEPKKAEARKAEARRLDKTPEPSVVVTKSSAPPPPMVIERDAPTVMVPRRRSWKVAGFAIAAASLAVGIAIGASSSKLSSHAPAAAAPPPQAAPLPKAAEPAANAPAQPAQPAIASTPAGDLPNAVVPTPAVAESKPAAKPAQPKGKAIAAPGVPSSRTDGDLVQSASAPIQPAQQKANDDDLRKFLDDRR